MTWLLDKIFAKRVIVNCDRDPYLHRWYVFRTPWVSLFIHKFVRDDEDRALHDHPWAFLVIPIWRGYVEHSKVERCTNGGTKYMLERVRRVWPFLGTRLRPAIYRHRVVLIDGKPAWSLFFHFRRIREWGFWPKEGFTHWQKWWNDKCE